MPPSIHPTAIVDPDATIGIGVEIGPYCVIGPNVALGDHCVLKAHVVVDGRTAIGPGTKIFPFASIGSPPQDLKYRGEDSELVIGSGCVIREHVTINPGTEGGGMKTVIGDNCLLMVGSHVGHDCHVGNNVILANNATLGGHVSVGNFAVLGGLSAVHQFVRIGDFAMIGGMSGVEADVIPFGLVKGERAFLAGLNLIGMERRGFDRGQVRKVQKAFASLFSGDGNYEERLERVASEFADDELVEKIVQFAREKTNFPLCQPKKAKTR
ncbi:MAG: acyl-ACP--UDP-N-acetylglucosamine O-acyltransferase [Alphaproteobacteria bacterium]|nr:acyl-ACP--UDP-N-acetylglucosamine O-acyltransferase [Alphaproteobacteria bacterium]